MKPNTTHTEHDQSTETPTLRDQFAMAALTGLLSKWVDGFYNQLNVKEGRKKLATKSYKIADAMMEARK